MIRIVSGDEVGRWVCDRMQGASFHVGGAQAIGCERDFWLIAGAIFENWTGRSMTIHWAVDERIPKTFLHAIADYAFNKCEIEKLIAPVDTGNKDMAKLAFKLGFTREAMIRNAGRTGDIALFTMPKKNCRFLSPRYAETLEVIHG